MCKKDIADAFFATKGWFFALVHADSGHLRFCGSSTEPDCYGAVGLTGFWAKFAFHPCKITIFPADLNRQTPLLLNRPKLKSQYLQTMVLGCSTSFSPHSHLLLGFFSLTSCSFIYQQTRTNHASAKFLTA